MEPVLWLRISGDLLWMPMGSDRGTARSVSSLERSSKLPGSACFCPFWARTRGERKKAPLPPQKKRHGPPASMWFYLPRYLCRSRSEPEASGSVLLLLHPFHTWAEVKLHVEAFLRGEVLRGDAAKTFHFVDSRTQMTYKLQYWCVSKSF